MSSIDEQHPEEVPELSEEAHVGVHHEDHGHQEESFIWKYIFSTDHKVIGIQYGITSLLFLALGFTLMLIMRWQLGNPGQPVPFIGNL